MLDPESQTLKDIFMQEGLCNEGQMLEIEEEFQRTGKPFADLLIDFGITTEDDLLQVIAASLSTDVVDFKTIEIEKSVIDMISADTARMYGIIPISFDGQTLTIASRNPLNYHISDELRFIINKDIHVVVAREKQIEGAIEKHYPIESESMQDMLNAFDTTVGEQEEGSIDNITDIENMANEAPIVKFVDVILYQAIKAKASDVHFEPFEKEFKIRYRVDGALYEMSPPPKNLAVPVISRVKIMSGLNISERRLPQDGRIQLKIGGRPVDLRVSTLPTQFGESVVLRILDRSVVNLDLDVLGIGADVLKEVRRVIHLPNGIIIITGPTGSGKTTTLYSALKEINDPHDKLLTAEDPVEYDLEGIIQLPIHDAVGMTFGRALRAFLRQDPDIIMIGEIRDFDTAQMAIQAALTGHFVFSTLHTNDAPGAITRLVDMGVEPFLINSSLLGVFAQRLIRKICPNCKTEFTPTDDDLKNLGIDREEVSGKKFFYGKGCSSCNNSGYKGRKAICEYMSINNIIRKMIMEKAPTIVLKEKARELGMRTLREDGIRSILDGETTLEEILKYTTA